MTGSLRSGARVPGASGAGAKLNVDARPNSLSPGVPPSFGRATVTDDAGD